MLILATNYCIAGFSPLSQGCGYDTLVMTDVASIVGPQLP